MSATGSPRSTEPGATAPGQPGATAPALSQPGAIGGLPWLLLVAAATALLVAARAQLQAAHAALIYLLIVLGGSSRLGRAWGVALAVLCFLTFNFFLLPPYYTFAIRDPLDWLVLVAFLATGVTAAHLLDRAQREARAARERAGEVDRLSVVGAEALNAGRAEDGVAAIARVLRERLALGCCEIYQRTEGDAGLRRVARDAAPDYDEYSEAARENAVARAARGSGVAEGGGGEAREIPGAPGRVLAYEGEARALALPLRVRERTVGVLRLASERPIRLDEPARRFAEALAYYAALGVERVRLVAEAEHAEALREADRLKDALLASVSHDLRTPLTTIKALAHEIGEGGDTRAGVLEAEADRLNRFVSDLLDLSRMNSGALPVAPELVPAEDLVGAALDQIRSTAGPHEIAVRQPDGGRLLVGRFDFVLALRALVNLIENACKYGGAAPVEVEVAGDGTRLTFTVADRGPGVPEADRERIFEPFYRGAGTAGSRGTGLGLSIARRLAEAQGGGVRHEPRPGGGSRFVLTLPAVAGVELEPG